jgi:hypothetical protein
MSAIGTHYSTAKRRRAADPCPLIRKEGRLLTVIGLPTKRRPLYLQRVVEEVVVREANISNSESGEGVG